MLKSKLSRYLNSFWTYRDLLRLLVIKNVKLKYGEGGAFMEDETGNCYFEAFMCHGTLGGILVVHYFDCDKQPIGEIEFRKVVH